MKLKRNILLGLVLSGVVHCFADDNKIERKPLSIVGSYQLGQIHQMIREGHPDSNVVVQRIGVWALQEGTINDRLAISLGWGGLFFNPYPAIVGSPDTQRKYFASGLVQAKAEYTFGDLEKPYLKLALGNFPYKYNPDAKNLGEYLFRASAYPGILTTGGFEVVNSAYASLQGFKASSQFGNGKVDLLLTSETTLAPLHDFSVSLLGSYTVGKALDLGAGVNFNRLIQVRPSLDTPKKLKNSYVKAPGDTGYYTFASTKMIGRASFDPKAFMSSEVFGKDDLKIYGEVAALGLTNYPFYYEKLSERMPMVIGFNIPTFKLLDVMSVEVESYTSKFPNDWRRVVRDGVPLPELGDTTSTPYNPKAYEKDNIKWSVYAKKEVVSGLSIFVQVARDHFRTLDIGWQPETNEVLTKKDHWYYLANVVYGF